MSTSRTVEVRVDSSVRWTAKSPGASWIALPPARPTGAFSGRVRALASVSTQVEVEDITELERLRPLAALRAAPGAVDPVLAERIPAQPGEEVVEDLLADPAAAPRRQLEAIARPG